MAEPQLPQALRPVHREDGEVEPHAEVEAAQAGGEVDARHGLVEVVPERQFLERDRPAHPADRLLFEG